MLAEVIRKLVTDRGAPVADEAIAAAIVVKAGDPAAFASYLKNLKDRHVPVGVIELAIDKAEEAATPTTKGRGKPGLNRFAWNPQNLAAVIEGTAPGNYGEKFAQDEGGKLYRYQAGVYKPDGAERVRAHVRQIVGWERWSSHLANETIEYIRVAAPHLWEAPPLDTINLKNGLLDWQTKTLRPHSPAFLSITQLPVAYNRDAICPNWNEQISATFPEDCVLAGVAWQIVAWLMLPIALQKALLILGIGGSGKSTFLNALFNFLGRRNTCGLSLQKLEADRFATSRLIGKLVNICADLPSTHLENSSIFKNITGDDPMLDAEYKFKESFDFKPFARLVFSANQPPQSKDATEAFFDRWVVLAFNKVYRGTEQEISRKIVDARLSTPAELSGVLNRALDALPAVLDAGLTITQSMRESHTEFRRMTDPLAIWLNRYTIEDPKAFIPRIELQNAYNTWAMSNGTPPMTTTAFGLALKKLRPKIQDRQRTYGGKVVWCYVGLGLASEANRSQAEPEPESNRYSN